MKLICTFGLFITLASAAKFPADIPQCKAADIQCLPRVITDIVHNHPNGHQGLSIPPLEPLRINRIDISQGSNSPIAIKLNFRDLDLSGISQSVINRVVGFGADPNSSKYEVYAVVPKITITGKYKIDGRVLVLPIQGEGNAHLVFDNTNLVVKYKPKVVEKNGKQYIQTEKFQLDFDPSRLNINLENLFNGDKALGDNMNQFLNQNWKEIFNELKPAITFAVEEILKGIINRIFLKIPYDEIFLKD
ncbi:protein takeout-like [Sitodiplosis mosellana]|uniref:protein takeout-like n=1 Tax=Sitodiplosis mosellana TaxID=263140 RepID=UPI00244498ED|nr:protein takeout-like [Sitodiplosis mosellana]